MWFSKKNERDDSAEVFGPEDDAVEIIDNEYSDYYSEYEDEFVPQEPKKCKKLKRFIIRLLILCVFLIGINVFLLFFTGRLWFNQPDKDYYPIRGAIVDSDMGEVNWKTLSHQNIKLAYIRATKGTAFKDETFEQNWKNSSESDLMTGAYHVFKLNKSGRDQAEYFCNALGNSFLGRLIPAVEVKLSGIDMFLSPDKDDAVKNLKEFMVYFQQSWGIKPMIICDSRSYEKYIASDFDDYSVMIADYFSQPDEGVKWDFWCFNPRVRLKGYKNSKEYISMFVYKDNISTDDFKNKYIC